MHAAVGDTLTIRGRYFKRGLYRNSVVFRRDGGRALFVKAQLATTKLIQVKVPAKLAQLLEVKNGGPVAGRFRLRVLAERLGKRFTPNATSPVISPARTPGAPSGPPVLGNLGGSPAPTAPPPVVTTPEADCDGDGMANSVDTDDDNDLLPDTTESQLGLDPCNADTDGDKVEDGYEYQSAKDLNDDEYQDPNQYAPYPGNRPYPNPLFKDAGVDYDGDSLTLGEEFSLWKRYGTRSLGTLLYSDGEAYSLSARLGGTGRRRPTMPAVNYPKNVAFMDWARGNGYEPVMLAVAEPWHDPANQALFDLRDDNRDGSVSDPLAPGSQPIDFTATPLPTGYLYSEATAYDLDHDGWISDDERDEDGDGLTNYDEFRGRMQPAYWNGCYASEAPYPVPYAGTSPLDADTDGDGVLDGADDQDHDDVPNLDELSRRDASGRPLQGRCKKGSGAVADPAPEKGFVNPFNPCLPYWDSRTCTRHPAFDHAPAPFSMDAQDIYYVFN
jgi:hypothetical protein